MKRNLKVVVCLVVGLVAAGVGCGPSGEVELGSTSQAVNTDFIPYSWPSGSTYLVTQGNGGLYRNSSGVCVSGGDHTGLGQYAWDFALPTGTPVLASKGGVVKVAQFFGTGDACYNGCGSCCPYACGTSIDCTNRGNRVVIAHDDGTTQALYLHLSSVGVSVGQRVAAGQQIGLSGNSGWSTGPHLHFMNSVRNDNTYYSQSVATSFNGTVPACNQYVTSSNTGGGGGTSPWCSANCGGGGWWCTGDSACIQNGVAGHNYHCPGNNMAPDRDQACALGCVIAASGYPDYCKAGTFCGSGKWCGNDCVNGYAKTLYNFSSTGAVLGVTQCQVGYTNQSCAIAPPGSPDYCY